MEQSDSPSQHPNLADSTVSVLDGLQQLFNAYQINEQHSGLNEEANVTSGSIEHRGKRKSSMRNSRRAKVGVGEFQPFLGCLGSTLFISALKNACLAFWAGGNHLYEREAHNTHFE